ncbi:uracil-DNA glycosylase [Salinisphaera sp. SPP-AMP-43]|uniref:uracil-DNA glycosylase n=1 Tax=Salinisphaera sp. SPP-AMP-43 TaxID=3121288 RepID=UPI003C6E2147
MRQPAPNCRRCPRLVALRREVRHEYPHYHAAPVPVFGPADSPLLIIGLAPGMHGANATGKPFVGDTAGELLYPTLHAHGFASPRSGHEAPVLYDCRITNAVKCLPPGNRPVAGEINACNEFLASEIATARVLLTLGGVAHKATVRALGLRQRDYVFGHGADYVLPNGQQLLASYHCSRYNTNTRRLTPTMFADIFAAARRAVDHGHGLSTQTTDAS